MWMLVDPTQKVLSSATLSNEICCCPFMFINLVAHVFFSPKIAHKQRCCYSLHYNSITSSYCNYPQVARWWIQKDICVVAVLKNTILPITICSSVHRQHMTQIGDGMVHIPTIMFLLLLFVVVPISHAQYNG